MKKIIYMPFNFRDKSGWLIGKYLDKAPLDTMCIVPHMSKVNDFKIRYCAAHSGSSVQPFIVTPKQLAHKIVEDNSDKRVITDIEKYVAIFGLIKQKYPPGFSPLTIPGLTQAVLRFISELKIASSGDVDFESIRRYFRNHSWLEEHLKNAEFALDVMLRYRLYMDKSGLLDAQDIYIEASRHIESLKHELLLVEGIYEIPSYQRPFFSALIKKIPEVIFLFCRDKGVSPDTDKYILQKTQSFLDEVLCWETVEIEPVTHGSVHDECYNFSSQSDEVEGIVKLIRKNFRDESFVSLNQVMAVFPSMPEYRSVVKRIFARYGIPCELIPGFSLDKEPSVTVLNDLLSFPSTFRWETLMNILTSPFFAEMDYAEAENFSFFSREQFENVGFSRADFKKQRGKNFALLQSVIEELDVKETTLDSWVGVYKSMILKMGWQPVDIEVKIALEETLLQLKGVYSVTREEFISILNKIFQLVEIQISKGRGMRVSGVLESVGIEKRLCFVGGATESNMPNAPGAVDIFLPDALKRQLLLDFYELRMARERLDLYRIIEENEKVIFTFPAKSGNRQQMKSILLFDKDEKTICEKNFTSVQKEFFKLDCSAEKLQEKFLSGGRLKISVTGLEKFLDCPYAFYLEYVENIKPYRIPEPEEAAAVWGTILHSAMKEVFQPFKNRMLGGDLNRLKESFSILMAAGIEDYYKRGEISIVYRDTLNMRLKEVGEKFFALSSERVGNYVQELEYKLVLNLPFMELTAQIDRIEKTAEGNLEIIDIKTGTASPPSYTEGDFFFKNNIQIPLYIWMYKQKYRPETIVEGAIWRLSFLKEKDIGSKKIEHRYSAKKLSYLNKDKMIISFLKDSADRLISLDTNKISGVSRNCPLCRYRGMCPYEKT